MCHHSAMSYLRCSGKHSVDILDMITWWQWLTGGNYAASNVCLVRFWISVSTETGLTCNRSGY